MRRRKRQPTPPGPPAPGFHHHPFRQLGGAARRPKPAAPPSAPPPVDPPSPAATPDDGDLFHREMAGVRPLSPAARSRVAPLPPAPAERAVTDPDAEALAELSDLVTGSGPFDLADSVEFVEGAVAGLDRRLVRRLRAGDFAYQSHLDLHGMIADEARSAIDRFLNTAHQKGQRCVLIIHGRGLNSKDQVPVLKNRVTTWLARGAWARLVLAFTSARPCDGGAGALYVLLRRQRAAKRPIHVTQGAKW
jgi:DNA-nicking Smr family endonuclease